MGYPWGFHALLGQIIGPSVSKSIHFTPILAIQLFLVVVESVSSENTYCRGV